MVKKREGFMEAHPHTIQQVFSNGGDIQYVLPHFQREYTWERDDWQTLLDDAYVTYTEFVTESRAPEHFMGSLVRVSNGARHGVTSYTLVDGQQRLTTISLLLCAIRVVVQETDPDAAKKIWRMLVNPDEKETAPSRYKLVPTAKHGDYAAYVSVLTDAQPSPSDSNIRPAYDYLLASVREQVAAGAVDVLKLYQTVLQCFQVVTIDLKPDEQPYKIFESLNGKGKPLTPADLVRNYVAMTLPYTMQEEIFTKHWAFIDNALQEKREVGNSGYGELTGFLRHYLAMRTRKLYNREHIYERFRDQVKELSPDAFAAEIATLHRFAMYYDRLLRPAREPDQKVRTALIRLQTFEMSTAFPFIIRVYDARDRGEITSEQFLDVLKMLENYAVRRFLCGKQANYLNSMFPLLWDDLDLADFSGSLRRCLATRQYPTDEEVRGAVRTRNAYERRNTKRLAHLFEVVNLHRSSGSGAYTVLDAAPTFEHIMPQSLTDAWKAELGEGWEETFANYLHTLGNLTPITQQWNSSLSNGSFEQKRKGLRENGLRLNSEYFARPVERWDEEAIITRADWLTDNILAIWPAISQQVKAKSFTKPRSVALLNRRILTKTWRDVLVFTAEEAAAKWGSSFPSHAAKFAHLFSVENPQNSRSYYQMTNGWWLCVHWSAMSIKDYCPKLAVAAGFKESDWHVEEE